MPHPLKPRAVHNVPARIGIVGTGFIAVGLCLMLRSTPDMAVSRVLTRRPVDSVKDVDPHLLTRSMADLLENSDLIVECSGDIIHACATVQAAHEAGLPVVTMAAEFHVTVGSFFSQTGLITEAEGDQPGSIAALREDALQMGFKPVVFGNIKGFLNLDPSLDEMSYWAKRNGISRTQVTSFTDGTKLQIEQALVANGLGADIAQRGLVGPQDLSLEDTGNYLGEIAARLGTPISDYVLNRKLPAGVFVVGEHLNQRPEVLRYLKLGDGPYYTLLRPYHLCHLELPRTIRRVLDGHGVLLNNSPKPRINVVAVAKRDLPAGTSFEAAIGGMELRGEAVRLAELPESPPIGLLTGARLKHSVVAGQTLMTSDVDIPDSLAKKAWEHIRQQCLELA